MKSIMNIRDNKRIQGAQGGYILLLTMLIISILLAISLGIYSLSIKEVILSSFLKQSSFALSAADRAIECTLYWDRGYPQNGESRTVFATSTSDASDYVTDIAQCDNIYLVSIPWVRTTGVFAATTTFTLSYVDGTCADVLVSKAEGDTTVISNGYNNCNLNDPRRIQRTIQVKTNI